MASRFKASDANMWHRPTTNSSRACVTIFRRLYSKTYYHRYHLLDRLSRMRINGGWSTASTTALMDGLRSQHYGPLARAIEDDHGTGWKLKLRTWPFS